eukprot:7134049-Alexandrium_andersonii.AAC.1
MRSKKRLKLLGWGSRNSFGGLLLMVKRHPRHAVRSKASQPFAMCATRAVAHGTSLQRFVHVAAPPGALPPFGTLG